MTPLHRIPNRPRFIRDFGVLRSIGEVYEHLRRSWRARQRLAISASAAAFAIIAITVVAPPAPATAAEILAGYNALHAQTLKVAAAVEPAMAKRDAYTAMPGIPQLAANGTNYDWAKIVLIEAGFPVTENNVTVFTRWMRQENGPNNWWNRNNPLNNGWGSGGGGGTGSYANLLIAAQNAAKALLSHPGYGAIVAAFSVSAPTEVTEQAIWASPWASGHYANGAHWHYSPVQVVTAPAGAWG